MKYLLSALLLLLSTSTFGSSFEQLVSIDDDTEITVETFEAKGNSLILWLPSEFGLSPRQTPTAEALSKLGIEVWIPDLHSAWFIPPGRYSLNNIDSEAIVKLIEKALSQNKTLYLLASGRSNVLALHGIRRYQLTGQNTQNLGGVLAINPRLFIRTPQGGEAAEYLPIATASNVPMYLLQPKNSGGFWRTAKLIEKLSSGGSRVFAQPLYNVKDGFHTNPDYKPHEATVTAQLPLIFSHAIYQLEALGGTPAKAAAMAGEELKPQSSSNGAQLKPYTTERKAPKLALPQTQGEDISLSQLQGRVVLVNFWATWCPPCVEEIPSLQRLYAAKHKAGLEILAVDVGESKQQITDFLSDKPVAFPVLLDEGGEALKAWNVHAFPTTLILDKQHRIRYAIYGGYDWNSEEVRNSIDLLLQEP